MHVTAALNLEDTSRDKRACIPFALREAFARLTFPST